VRACWAWALSLRCHQSLRVLCQGASLSVQRTQSTRDTGMHMPRGAERMCVRADAALCCRLVSLLCRAPFFLPSVRRDASCPSRVVGPCGLRRCASRRVGERCMRWKGLRRERSEPAAHACSRKGQAQRVRVAPSPRTLLTHQPCTWDNVAL
jgi:hypothetical protein